MFRYILAAVLGLSVVGCVERQALAEPVFVQTQVVEEVIVAPAPPPPPVVERIVVRRGHVWCNGHHYWVAGRGWVWRPGYWVVARPGHVWVHPRYYYRGRTLVFVRGHWRR